MYSILEKLKSEIIVAVIGIAITIILPVEYISAIKSLVIYCLNSQFTNLLRTICIILLLLINFYIVENKVLSKKLYYNSLAIFIITSSFLGIKDFNNVFSPYKYGNINLNFLGCFMVNSNNFFTKDLESNLLEKITHDKIESLFNNHYILPDKSINYNYVSVPKFYTIFYGIDGIRKRVEDITNSRSNINISFLLLKSINSQKQSCLVFYNKEILTFSTPIELIKEYYSSLSLDFSFGEENLTSFLTTFLVSYVKQLSTDLNENETNYLKCHSIINESKKILDVYCEKTKNVASLETVVKIHKIQSYFKAYYLYKSAIILENQKSFFRAAKLYIRIIKEYPYFPCSNYESFKILLEEQYKNELYNTMYDMIKMYENNRDMLNTDSTEYIQLSNKSDYLNLLSISIVNLLKKCENDRKVNNIFEYELENITKIEPNKAIYWYLRGELIKYIYKGEARVNDLYIERIDESVKYFNEALKCDESFNLIHIKITGLNFIKKIFYSNNLIKEGDYKDIITDIDNYKGVLKELEMSN